MRRLRFVLFMLIAGCSAWSATGSAQEVKIKKSMKWELSGRVQLQYSYNTSINADAEVTTNGFRLRRGRFQVKGYVTQFIRTKIQAEIRDNSPRLKDAEGTLLFPASWYLRMGQFKVPVWREEFMRSSGSLMLIERSAAALFLLAQNLSARQIGFEVGKKWDSGLRIKANISNGAGEGGREDAGRPEDDKFVNNGKMLAARIDFPFGKIFKFGLSGVINNTGSKDVDTSSTGTNSTFSPDFGIYLPKVAGGLLDIEGGLAIGKTSGGLLQIEQDQKYVVYDLTTRWKKKLKTSLDGFAGLSGWELAAGVSFVDANRDISNNEFWSLRFGPAFYFGKNTRIQFNGAYRDFKSVEDEDRFNLVAQGTFNF